MTKSTTTRKPAATAAASTTTSRTCGCGCGVAPKGRKARFRPGHDARLRGVLLRAAEATGPDATTDEQAASAAEVAALPDAEWATRWHAARHPEDAERVAARVARWADVDEQ